MGTTILTGGINEQLLRTKKAFAKAIEDVSTLDVTDKESSEGTFESEHFSLVKKHIDEALEFYAPPFCEKVLQTVIAELAEKKKEYELKVKRQDADNELLNVTGEWPTEKLERLLTILKDF